MSVFERQRQTMVEHQIISRGISDPAVLAAMRTVPREAFVPTRMRQHSYEDRPLPIEESQTISQPYIVALMAESLSLSSADRVLEIGIGSGYAAAVLSLIVSEVFGIERYAALAELAAQRAADLGYDNIHVRCGDGTAGWPEHAPFDAILVSASGPKVPESLLHQLKVGGRLVIPVGPDLHSQELLRVVRVDEHNYQQTTLTRVQFVPLVGSEGWKAD